MGKILEENMNLFRPEAMNTLLPILGLLLMVSNSYGVGNDQDTTSSPFYPLEATYQESLPPAKYKFLLDSLFEELKGWRTWSLQKVYKTNFNVLGKPLFIGEFLVSSSTLRSNCLLGFLESEQGWYRIVFQGFEDQWCKSFVDTNYGYGTESSFFVTDSNRDGTQEIFQFSVGKYRPPEGYGFVLEGKGIKLLSSVSWYDEKLGYFASGYVSKKSALLSVAEYQQVSKKGEIHPGNLNLSGFSTDLWIHTSGKQIRRPANAKRIQDGVWDYTAHYRYIKGWSSFKLLKVTFDERHREQNIYTATLKIQGTGCYKINFKAQIKSKDHESKKYIFIVKKTGVPKTHMCVQIHPLRRVILLRLFTEHYRILFS